MTNPSADAPASAKRESAKPPPPDRLTQIQDCVDKLSEIFFISVGATQRDAPLAALHNDMPVTAWTPEQIAANTQSNKELAASASKDIVQTCKVIDYLVDRLPGINHTVEDQLNALRVLELESDRAGDEMDEWTQKAELKLAEIKAALRFIADDQFEYMAKRNVSNGQ
ncbi:hypothetical protein BC830DRAFT_1148467 [Chytriomyces sp. MP71]|nr:hypothetical protein BC830DRAFT_1148467 [Chytriomyces sp. MP71]